MNQLNDNKILLDRVVLETHNGDVTRHGTNWRVLPSSRGSGGLGGAPFSSISSALTRLFFSSFLDGGGTYRF